MLYISNTIPKPNSSILASLHTVKNRLLFVMFLMTFNFYAGLSQQMPVYSTYTFNKYIINPGFTGIDNEYRAYGFFRTQWTSMPGRPTTGGATVEGSFWKDRIGAGLNVINDRVGLFNQTSVGISYAQKVNFAKEHQISFGIQGFAEMNRIDFSKAHQQNLFDPGISEQNPLKTSYDLSVGISYKFKGLLIGFAALNIVQSKAKFASIGSEQVSFQYLRHYTAFVQYKISLLKQKFNITPMLFLRKAELNGFQIDATVLFDYKNIVFVGTGYRNSFGVITMAGVNILNMFTIAYAYDITTQKTLSGQVGSTHEILAGFHIPSNFKSKKQDLNQNLITAQSLEELQRKNDSVSKVNQDLVRLSDSLKTLLASEKLKLDSLKVLQESESKTKEYPKATPLTDERNSNEANPNIRKPFSSEMIIEPLQTGHTFTLDKILFEYKRSDIKPQSIPQLDNLVLIMSKHPNMRIAVSGFTDNIGSEDYNMNLSKARAKSVTDYLNLHGISTYRLEFKGMGSANPVADNNTENGRSLNRRVEFVITNE